MSSVSVFEKPIARFKISEIENFLISDDPWELREKLITQGDIEDFIINSNRRIPPGVFTDENDGKPMNVGEGTAEDHLARIAWLVENWDEDKSEPLEFEAGGNMIHFSNGLHRYMAMVELGYSEVEVQFGRGKGSLIEASESFIEWVGAPAHSGSFGESVISSENETYEVRVNELSGQVWVRSNEKGLVVKGKLKGNDRAIELVSEHGVLERVNEEVSVSRLKQVLIDEISPIFMDLPKEHFDKMGHEEYESTVTFNINP